MMTRLDKIKRLDEACKQLKSEFVGLDGIIDQIHSAITPWYVTPEVIKRPVIISLWGMTGTGKSSVIKRLLDLLELRKNMVFDCGAESNDSGESIDAKINQFLNMEDINGNIDELTQDMIFVFDEFQHARTIDEQGNEVNKSNLRPVWTLMDSGVMQIKDSNWDTGIITSFVEDFQNIAETAPSMPVRNLIVEKKEDVAAVLSHLGFFWYDREVPGVVTSARRYGVSDDDNKDPYRPLALIEDRVLRPMLRKAANTRQGGAKGLVDDLSSCGTVGEVYGILTELRNLAITPRNLDCSKSLVFVIGNLDEAYQVDEEISPDVEADMFNEITEKVTVNTIKAALQQRFRSEQIARIGNTIIKYPTLKEVHFRKIIENEVIRITKDFYNSTGIRVLVSPNVFDLLYSEGVYPVQGVRPVFTTIGTILTPLLSDIIIHSEETGKKQVIIETEPGFRQAEKVVKLMFDGENDVVEKKIKLVLGELRNIARRSNRYEISIHEAGHAILQAWETGNLPSSIISVMSDSTGGICWTNENDEKVKRRSDIYSDIKISMAGWCAENITTGRLDKDKVLVGAVSDIQNAWSQFSKAVYRCGFYDEFRPYSSLEVTSVASGIPEGCKDDRIEVMIRSDFSRLQKETEEILELNREFLIKTATILGERGKLTESEFRALIEENNGPLNLEHLEKVKREKSDEWYKEVVLKA